MRERVFRVFLVWRVGGENMFSRLFGVNPSVLQTRHLLITGKSIERVSFFSLSCLTNYKRTKTKKRG